MSNQHQSQPRFQVRPSDRPGGYYWEAFDTQAPDKRPGTPTLDKAVAQARADDLNAMFPDNVITNSPLNPNHPSSAAYVKPKSHKLRTALIIVGVLFAGLVSCTALVGGILSNTDAPVSVTAGSPTVPAEPTTAPTEDTADPTPVPTKTTPAKPKLTRGQEQAVGSAESYLEYTAFSRKGLIRQLTKFEGYSAADATYAVDYIKVNWNDQAAKSAKSYLEYTHFSRSGLIRQLESFEGFTHSQALYGVKKAGL